MISQPLPVAVDRANIRQDAPKAKTRDSSRHLATRASGKYRFGDLPRKK